MTKTENHMLKDGKSIMNTQSEKPKFFGTKTDLKKLSKIPMPPLRMNRSVQSINHTNDNTTTIIIIETSTKTFFIIIIRNMLQNNFSHAIFFKEGVMSRNRIIHRLRAHKYRRGFDLCANIVKIQQRTPRRCSYFQFVSSRLSNRSKPYKIPEIWSSPVLQ